MRRTIVLLVVLGCACQPSVDQSHQSQEHVHESSSVPMIEATLWSDSLELFLEYPVLVVDKTSRFSAHLTRLKQHKPVERAQVTASLIGNGKGIRQTVVTPTTPGLYSPALRPQQAGRYQLVFDIKTEHYEERLIVEDVPVYASLEEAVQDQTMASHEADKIEFPKEQAWVIQFQTAPVIRGEIYQMIQTSGIWKTAPGGYKSMTASTSGIVDFTVNNLTEGTTVRRGQVLMSISSQGLTSNNLSAEIEMAAAHYKQALADYTRKKTLFAEKIISQAEFEEVERNYRIDSTAYQTLQAGYSGGRKVIGTPFDGFVQSIMVNNGDFVEEGDALITIGSNSSRLLETQISPSQAFDLDKIHNIYYQPAAESWSNIRDSGGTVLSVGQEVASDQPLIPVFAQINEVVGMPVGSITEVQIAIGDPTESLQIPETALLEDFGNYSVIVQLTGEKFEQRPVMTGRRNGKFVEILQGLSQGEMVVTKGSYQVKMAPASGTISGHGHPH